MSSTDRKLRSQGPADEVDDLSVAGPGEQGHLNVEHEVSGAWDRLRVISLTRGTARILRRVSCQYYQQGHPLCLYPAHLLVCQAATQTCPLHLKDLPSLPPSRSLKVEKIMTDMLQDGAHHARSNPITWKSHPRPRSRTSVPAQCRFGGNSGIH